VRGRLVVGVDAEGIDIQGAGPLGRLLAERAGAELARHGQAVRDCTLPGHPEIFVVGDLMALDSLPGLAEVALQSGLHAASQIRRRLDGDARPRRFRYRDLGSLAAVSRSYAIGERSTSSPGGIL
jgi:NADH dehydrogenase